MKKVIFSMKAFYISLFVVLFFPLGLMGQGTEKAELADKEFVYIKDANGWVMCAKEDGTLAAQKDLNDGGVLWQVVDDLEDKLYLQNLQHKTFLKYDEANGVYCLVENMMESTPIQVNGGQWYLGTKTETETITATLTYVISTCTKSASIFDWDGTWTDATVNGTHSISSSYQLYYRPLYDVSLEKWKISFNFDYVNVGTNEFRDVIYNSNGCKGTSTFAGNKGDKILSSIKGFVGNAPTKKVSDGVNTDTKAYKLDKFNFVHRQGETEQKVHEFHEVIYASNKDYPSKGYSYDYSTVKLELPVDGLSSDNGGELMEILGGLLGGDIDLLKLNSEIEKEVEKTVYFLSGFYRWYDYSNGSTLVENKGTIEHKGFSFNLNLVFINISYESPVGYFTTNNNAGEICLSIQNPGTTTYKIPADFGPTSEPIKIACDVSNYDDYGVSITSDGVITITEPTLSYRVIYEIRHANEMRTNLDACKYDSKTKNKKFLEIYNIIAPEKHSVKIGPEYACNNSASSYYITASMIARITTAKWEKNGSVINNPSYDSDNRLIEITAPEKGKSDTYILRNNKDKEAEQRYIAKFVVTGYDAAIVGPSLTPLNVLNFYTEEERKDLKFDLKAEVDFDDIYDANNPKMYPNPLPWEDISAGFVYPGLIDSKNKQREPEFVAMSEYALLSTTEGYKKRGSTLPTIKNHGEDLQNEGKNKDEGYFLYVDATKKSSKVADLSINGDLCPNSKIYVSAWIANASNETSNYPNLNFVMMGVMTDDNGNIISETQLSTFTTGDIQPHDGQWQNVMFEFATTNVEYDKYRIRIENNNAAVFGTGNDFAIDDIKIYMTSRTEASITQNRSCPAWNPTNSDLNKSNVAILRADIVDVPDGDIYMNYTWLKQIGESADGNDVDVELLDLKNYIDVTANAVDPNKIFGKIKVNKAWIENISNTWGEQELKKDVTISTDPLEKIVVYKNTDAFFALNNFSDDLEASAYFFTIEGEGDDERIVLYIVHKSSLFQQFEEYCSIVTPINLDNYISEYKTKYADSAPDDEDALEALYNELKCGTRSKFEVLPYASIMLSKDASNNYDFDFTQAVVKHLAEGQNYTFAVEAYYEGTETKDGKEVKVMKPYNCSADWLLVTNDGDKYKWEDAQKIITWRANGGTQPDLNKGNTLVKESVTSFQVEKFSGPLHYIAIPNPKVTVEGNAPCAIPVEIYLYDSIPATLADPNVSAAVEEGENVWKYDRPAAICNEPIIVRIPNSLVKDGDNISLNLDIDYFDKYLFAEIAKYNAQEGNANPDPWNNIYLYEYDEKKQLVPTSINFNIKDENNQTLTLDLLKKDDDVTISGGHAFASGQKYHFAGHNVVNGVKITPPFQFDVYVVPDEVVWTGDKGTAWHNDANWDSTNEDEDEDEEGFIPLSVTNVRIPNTVNKPVLNLSEDGFEEGANELLKHDIVAVEKDANNVLVDNTSATLNSCNDIYFAAGAQLANQHMLNYERAFVDVPFTSNDDFGKSNKNFKIMSFPLRNVYRGDLYIPRNYNKNTKEDIGDGDFDFDFSQTDGQFEAVPVDNRAYNSFYVKAYVSAIEQNYVNENNDVDVQVYTYENTSWSDPTSVLNFEFKEAHGYAVSLDAKINFDFETEQYNKNIQSFVRLPKSATEYYLFMDFGEGNEIELKGLGSTWPTYEISEFQLDKDGKRIRSSEGHKLVYDKSHGASVTFENKKGIFLIGNPFMTGMKVKEFLQENKTYLSTNVYYTYHKDIINVTFVDKGYENDDVIPPFGAMFVKGNSKTQTFKFTPEMMSYEQSTEPSIQQRAPRMVEERELLTITAEVDGARSRTYIEKDFAANNEYLDTEDADLLVLDADLTPISVYSVATGAALAYNSVTDMEFVPLGLLLVDSTIVAESVRFTFDGVDYFYDELYLYDALYNSYLPLIDGVALELEMPESGELRYFITDTKHNVGGGVTTSDDLVEGSKVCVFTTEGEACIIADDIISEATVYDIAGRLIYYSDQISSSQHNISLPNGIYMLKVVVNSNLSTHKIILK